jgi:hypothetical protein
MRVIHRAALLSVGLAALALPLTPASAAAAPLPETVLHLKSIDWQPRTGNVEVTARVKCTGDGIFRWGVSLDQRVRAHASTRVPCDGDGFLSTLVLDPRNGRFHPGTAGFGLEQIVMNDDAGIGSATYRTIRISAR